MGGSVGGVVCVFSLFVAMVNLLNSYVGLRSRSCSSVGAAVFPAGTSSTSTLIVTTTCNPFHTSKCDKLFRYTGNNLTSGASVSASLLSYG